VPTAVERFAETANDALIANAAKMTTIAEMIMCCLVAMKPSSSPATARCGRLLEARPEP
jgi:hypothetical protein